MAQTIVVDSKGMVYQPRIVKAPNDVITLLVDFSLFFDTDTASTVTATADSGLTVGTPTVSANVVSVLLSGGSNGYAYDLTVKLAGTTETKEVVVQIAAIDMDNPQVGDYWYRGYC